MKYCEEFEALLDLYVDGELEAAEMIRVQEHLDSCSACRTYVDELLAIRAAFPEVKDTIVPEGFAEGVMTAIAASAPKTKKRPTPWKKVLIPMAACLAVVIMVFPLSGQMNNARMESAAPAAAPAEAPAAAIAAMMDDAADQMDSPAEVAVESVAEAEPETLQDVRYAYTSGTSALSKTAVSADSAAGAVPEKSVPESGTAPVPTQANKPVEGDPRAVVTLPPEGAWLELLANRTADRWDESHMEFNLPFADYEMLLIQLDESGLDYLAEEDPTASGDTILVIVQSEQIQQN